MSWLSDSSLVFLLKLKLNFSQTDGKEVRSNTWDLWSPAPDNDQIALSLSLSAPGISLNDPSQPIFYLHCRNVGNLSSCHSGIIKLKIKKLLFFSFLYLSVCITFLWSWMTLFWSLPIPFTQQSLYYPFFNFICQEIYLIFNLFFYSDIISEKLTYYEQNNSYIIWNMFFLPYTYIYISSKTKGKFYI